MKPYKWPFKPDHITIDGETVNVQENIKYGSISEEYLYTLKKRIKSLRKLTGIGIIHNAHLDSLQTIICANLGNPTTIVEFSLLGEAIRTDSKLLFFSMHEPCKILRKHTDEELCLNCDEHHAKLFYQLHKDNIDIEIIKRISNSKYITEYKKRGGFIQYHPDDKQPYLEYDCPLLGYRELIFPIFFEKTVIAVFFVGQLCIKHTLNKIKDQQKYFFENPSYILLLHCPDTNERNMIYNEIKTAHDKYIKDPKHILDRKDYDNFISTAKKELHALEKTLQVEMNIKRDRYIRRKINSLVQEFLDKINIPDLSSEKKWDLLWQSAGEVFYKLIIHFNLQYIIIFASKRFEQKEARLDIVMSEGRLPKEIEEELKENTKLVFNLKTVPNNIRNRWSTSIDAPCLFDAIEPQVEIDKKLSLIRLFPIPFFPNASLSVLIGYKKDNPPVNQLNTALGVFYTIILSTFSATLASIAEEARERALGRMTHEFEVPLNAIRGATESIQDSQKACELLDEDYPSDIWSWTELLERLIENADVYRYLRRQTFDLYYEKVFLLKDVIAPTVRQVKLICENRFFSPDKITYKDIKIIPWLWLDRNRFQQVLFNLLSNSIKYAFNDPSIFRVEIVAEEKGDRFYIYIRDWGQGIHAEERERIFEEEYRGTAGINANVSGQGLGLWIVRQIIEKHGGKIRVSNLFAPTEFEIVLPYSLASRPYQK